MTSGSISPHFVIVVSKFLVSDGDLLLLRLIALNLGSFSDQDATFT